MKANYFNIILYIVKTKLLKNQFKRIIIIISKSVLANLVKLDCMAAGKFDRRVESDRSPSKLAAPSLTPPP